MIDPKNFRQLEPENRVLPHLIDTVALEKLKDVDKLTLSSMVYGFNFRERPWGKCAMGFHT